MILSPLVSKTECLNPLFSEPLPETLYKLLILKDRRGKGGAYQRSHRTDEIHQPDSGSGLQNSGKRNKT